jgi:hypothetical protein
MSSSKASRCSSVRSTSLPNSENETQDRYTPRSPFMT